MNVSMTKPGAGRGGGTKIALVPPPILPCGKTSGEKQVKLGWLWRMGALWHAAV